eukprot:2915746-Pyramimonas_sp.AAC.1
MAVLAGGDHHTAVALHHGEPVDLCGVPQRALPGHHSHRLQPLHVVTHHRAVAKAADAVVAPLAP